MDTVLLVICLVLHLVGVNSHCTHTYSSDNRFILVEAACFGSSGQVDGNNYCLSTFPMVFRITFFVHKH